MLLPTGQLAKNDVPQPRTWRQQRLVLYFVPMFLVTAFIASCICFVGARAVPLHWETSHPEAAVSYNALRFVNTGRIYPRVEESPYTPVAYAPLYYILLGLGAKLGSLGIDGVLRFGRAISLLSFLLIAFIVYRWCRAAGAAVLFALMGATFVLSQQDAFPWNATARPDLLAILLSLAGLYSLARAQTNRAVVVSGLLLSTAILTKQSTVAGPLAAVSWLLIERRFRTIAVLVLSFVAPLLVAFAALHARGEHIFANLSYLAHAGRHPDAARQLLCFEFGSVNPRFVLLGLAILGAISAWFRRNEPLTLAAIYFGISWFIVLGTISHVGSNNYYFIEAWTASALVAVFGLLLLHDWAAGAAHWAVLGVILLSMFPLVGGAKAAFRLIRSDGLIRTRALTRTVQGANVLTDVPYLAAQSRKPEMLDSFFTTILERNNLSSPLPISSRVRSQNYDLIVVATNSMGIRRYRGFGFLSPSIMRELTTNYRFFCAVRINDGLGQLGYDTINIAVPKSRQPTDATVSALAGAGCVEGGKPAEPPGQKSYAFILQ